MGLRYVSGNMSTHVTREVVSSELKQWNSLLTKAISIRTKKLKLSHYTPRWRLGERRYSSYSFSTSTLNEGEWSASRTARVLAPGKGSAVPTVQVAGRAQEPVWTRRLEEKFSASA
jgi:hypothetical protein